EDYRWSHYRAFVGDAKPAPWLEVHATLALFGKKPAAAREAYRRFAHDGKGAPSPLLAVKGQLYLGSEGFRDDVARRIGGHDSEPARARPGRGLAFVPLAAVRAAVAAEFGPDEA